MATKIKITPTKTYATAENAEKAVKNFGDELRYVVMKLDDGRFAPVFVGESAVKAGVFFAGFSVIG